MSVNIHGKKYVTVAERLKEAGDSIESINTEVISHPTDVIVKATVTIKKTGGTVKTYTGISAANSSKMIEKQSPYEVAETSAVGRALGFAGFGVVDGIATADEVVKAGKTLDEAVEGAKRQDWCYMHAKQMKEDKHGRIVHWQKDKEDMWEWCQGKGWHPQA